MTEKELKKLSRAELLELLLIQTKETERLQAQLDMAQQMLRDRQLQVRQAGDLAQAALAVNGVMEAAQAAASQYLENIARMEADAKIQCENMLKQARAEAERICGVAASGKRPIPSKPKGAPSGKMENKMPEKTQGEEVPSDSGVEADQLLAELHQLLGDE